jgi:predicted GTPase
MLTERQRRKKSNRRAEAFDEIDLEALTPEAVSENLFEHLRRSGIEATSEQIEAITRKAADVLTYVPKIGLLGKTGVGKSSLCNALFGAEVARIDDVRACTRDVAKFLVSLSEKQGIVLVDVPGIGETTARDAEYAGLYKQLIPQLDLAMLGRKGRRSCFQRRRTLHQEGP